MKNLLLIFSIFAVLISFSNESTAQETPTEPTLMVVKFHADWCGKCRALGPALTDLTNKMDGEPVLFTQLDFTNNSTEHQSKLLGSALGIQNIVDENYGTGFLLVIDSKTKEVKARLTHDQTVTEMTNKINSFL